MILYTSILLTCLLDGHILSLAFTLTTNCSPFIYFIILQNFFSLFDCFSIRLVVVFARHVLFSSEGRSVGVSLYYLLVGIYSLNLYCLLVSTVIIWNDCRSIIVTRRYHVVVGWYRMHILLWVSLVIRFILVTCNQFDCLLYLVELLLYFRHLFHSHFEFIIQHHKRLFLQLVNPIIQLIDKFKTSTIILQKSQVFLEIFDSLILIN